MTNLVVLGAGLIGSRHAKSILESERCNLVAVVEPNPALHSDPTIQYLTSVDDVTEHVDGAIIATPTSTHFSVGAAVAEKGWHMLIEKPVTATDKEADELEKLVTAAGVHCLVGHHRRYHVAIDKLKELIAQDVIGTPVTSTMIWAVKKPDDYFVGNWRAGEGSPIMINTVHDLDILRFVLGEVDTIISLGSAMQRKSGRVESAAIALRFETGMVATISVTDTAPSPWGFEAGTGENPNIGTSGQDMWWITGTKGAVSFPSLTVWTGAPDWSCAPSPTIIECEKTVPLDAQLDHFIDVIERKAEPKITVRDAAKSLALTRKVEEHLNTQI